MPTFLTTSKMAPELQERILASVRGRRGQLTRARIPPRVVALMRVAALCMLVTAVVSVMLVRRRNHDEREHARASLLLDVRAKGAALTPYDTDFTTRAEEEIMRLATPYEGDLVSDELRAPNALTERLARPFVYVRGPIGSMLNAQAIAMSAAVSSKDSLVSCLVDPPKSRTEKAMLPKVRAAYARDPLFEKTTANVTRLADAELGLPLLSPPWILRVTEAEELADLSRLRRELEHAPVERAVQAARSDALLVALDEEGERGGPTELDGERPHKVRVALVDLRAKKVLLRIQRTVDPRFISDAERAVHASGLDACALAMDVREAVSR